MAWCPVVPPQTLAAACVACVACPASPRQQQGWTYTLQSENFFYFTLLFLARAAPARFVISPSLPPANETRHVDEQVDEEGEGGAKGAGRIVL